MYVLIEFSRYTYHHKEMIGHPCGLPLFPKDPPDTPFLQALAQKQKQADDYKWCTSVVLFHHLDLYHRSTFHQQIYQDQQQHQPHQLLSTSWHLEIGYNMANCTFTI